jgi:hypothetical protein
LHFRSAQYLTLSTSCKFSFSPNYEIAIPSY